MLEAGRTIAAERDLNFLVPHPIEIVLAVHVLLALVVLVVGVALASTRRVRMGWIGWVGFAVLVLGPFLFLGPIGAAVLLGLHTSSRSRPTEGMGEMNERSFI